VADRRHEGASRPPRVYGGRWEVVRQLGRGGQGTAYLVRDLTTDDGEDQYVLKTLRHNRREPRDRRAKRLERFEREIAALNRLDLSSNIPSLIDSRVSPQGSYFVTPYAGENLELLSDLVEPQAIMQRFRGLVDAAKFANDRGVVHRDIKPNNATVRGTAHRVWSILVYACTTMKQD